MAVVMHTATKKEKKNRMPKILFERLNILLKFRSECVLPQRNLLCGQSSEPRLEARGQRRISLTSLSSPLSFIETHISSVEDHKTLAKKEQGNNLLLFVAVR